MAVPESIGAVVSAIEMSLGLIITTPELATAQAIETALSSAQPGRCFCADAGAVASLHRIAISGVATAAAARTGAPLGVACASSAAVERLACRLASGLDQIGLSVSALMGGEAYRFERQRFETAKATRPLGPANLPSLRLTGLPWPEVAGRSRREPFNQDGFALCDLQQARRANICYGTLAEFARQAEFVQEPGVLLLDDVGEYLDASVRHPAICADAPGGFYLEVCPDAYLARYKSLAALLYS